MQQLVDLDMEGLAVVMQAVVEVDIMVAAVVQEIYMTEMVVEVLHIYRGNLAVLFILLLIYFQRLQYQIVKLQYYLQQDY